MATVASSAPRTEFFRQLKRVCVPLSQITLRPRDQAVDSKETLRLLESLISLWETQASSDASVLDDKLAEYGFFPLSYLLRDSDRYSVRVVETAIRFLRVLILHGWKAKTSPELFRQLLDFLSLFIGGVPGQPKPDLPEETLIEGYRALSALFGVAQPAHLAGPPVSPSERKGIHALAPGVTVMLDGVTDGAAPAVQLEAAQSLRVVFSSVKDAAVLAKFLPGTVSALTKVLSPPQANRTQRRVLLSCLDILKLVLTNVLGDIKVRPLLNKLESHGKSEEMPANGSAESESPAELTPAWLKGTAAQVKIALSAVLKLRAHESVEVQSTLYRLCVSLLDECHLSLASCRSILVESAMMLEDEDSTASRLQTSLRDLAGVYPDLEDSIKSALYSWINGLPRVMQSSDERVKQLAIRSILRGSKLAASLRMDSPTLDDALGDSLRDSIITLIKGSKQLKVVDDVGEDVTKRTDLVMFGTDLPTYAPVVLNSEGQKSTRNEVGVLISRIGSPAQQVKLAASMLSHVRDSEGVEQIASFWLAFELLKSTYAQSSDVDELLDLSSLGESRYQEDAFRELYEFSASVVSAHSDSIEADWRLEAIALEVIAFASSRLKADFRPELIDVLYPVTTFLGAPNPQLRRHAITSLNILAASCGYDSVSDLIVDNADYMVNSVSLRLNTFDISPASTKVLTMVIRLTGPRLVPFLDDVVAAIFAALDNYHGYPVLVENLFSVLSEVVMQGVKSDALLLKSADSKAVDHKKKPPQSAGVPGILQALEKRLERELRTKAEEDADIPFKSHPKKPWGASDKTDSAPNEATILLDKLTNPIEEDRDEEQQQGEEEGGESDQSLAKEEQQKGGDETKKQTPTYALLARVLTLAQHHLTSPAPTLRKSLLDLLATAGPALAPDEDAFLPLVHALWPVAAARLYDPEPYVCVAACGALAALCAAAGDFLAARFKDEWWVGSSNGKSAGGGGDGAGGMRGCVRRIKTEAEKRTAKNKKNGERSAGRGQGTGLALGMARRSTGGGGQGRLNVEEEDEKGGILIPVTSSEAGDGSSAGRLIKMSSADTGAGAGALGRFALASQAWEAVLGLLTALVTYVRVDDDMFDDILALVVDVLPRRPELREALEVVNADAVWLAMYERGMVTGGREVPVVEGLEFAFARV